MAVKRSVDELETLLEILLEAHGARTLPRKISCWQPQIHPRGEARREALCFDIRHGAFQILSGMHDWSSGRRGSKSARQWEASSAAIFPAPKGSRRFPKKELRAAGF
jgi:hypothetical protein